VLLFCIIKYPSRLLPSRSWLQVVFPDRRHRQLYLELWCDLHTGVIADDVTQRIFLPLREVSHMALAEHEHVLVPEDGQRARRVRVGGPEEVEDECVEHLVQQRVLLVQDVDEKRGRLCQYMRACVQVRRVTV
jgi:hypothetical protein